MMHNKGVGGAGIWKSVHWTGIENVQWLLPWHYPGGTLRASMLWSGELHLKGFRIEPSWYLKLNWKIFQKYKTALQKFAYDYLESLHSYPQQQRMKKSNSFYQSIWRAQYDIYNRNMGEINENTIPWGVSTGGYWFWPKLPVTCIESCLHWDSENTIGKWVTCTAWNMYFHH